MSISPSVPKKINQYDFMFRTTIDLNLTDMAKELVAETHCAKFHFITEPEAIAYEYKNFEGEGYYAFSYKEPGQIGAILMPLRITDADAVRTMHLLKRLEETINQGKQVISCIVDAEIVVSDGRMHYDATPQNIISAMLDLDEIDRKFLKSDCFQIGHLAKL